jgi:hypothetical protein
VFDALALNRPVVLVEGGAPSRADLALLSSAEVDGSRLAGLTATWSSGEIFDSAFDLALARLLDQRDVFVASHYVNIGAAGAAAAAAIASLAHSPVAHPAPQVRAQSIELMQEKSRLAQENRRLQRANDSLRSRPAGLAHRLTGPVVHHFRIVVARWPRVERTLVRLKQRLSG